ncbi:MAG TPA: glycosyltransferase family 9 protein [Nitrospiraceae bacterium]|jgi:ADP-heptose:LPS heptosyltransferase|nr:glycosyltransferase family 9 protein [Nitrospiraceae bacterium]
MATQVLIINITRMGDLVQTGPLIDRLHREQPGVAIDLVVDRRFAPMAALLPGLRHIEAFDFEGLVETCRVMAKDVTALYRQVADWAQPLVERRYDRVINLTFNRRSGLLAACVGAPDIRGVAAARDGTTVVRNPWMGYFTDLHHYRRFNRFNLVDLYALGGSGHGPFAPLSLRVDPAATEWARTQIRDAGRSRQGAAGSLLVPQRESVDPRPLIGEPVEPRYWVAVQVGASDVTKAWRPAYFGRAMAILSRHVPVGFVMIGGQAETDAVRQAVAAYKAAEGSGPLRDVSGQTTVEQLVALLAECRLLLTNDTGPMHAAVAVGTPVVDISVGHVDFRETGPYGPGHWVVQPDIACAPCGFDQVCLHHTCKEHVTCDDVAALCLHALGAGPFPGHMRGVRVYASAVDDDGLAGYHLRAGREDAATRWYGEFWRRYWFEALTEQPSRLAPTVGPAPDAPEVRALFKELKPLAEVLVNRADALPSLCRRYPLPVETIRDTQAALRKDLQRALKLTVASPAFGPPTVALVRETHNAEEQGIVALALAQARAYATWRDRLAEVAAQVTEEPALGAGNKRAETEGCYARYEA